MWRHGTRVSFTQRVDSCQLSIVAQHTFTLTDLLCDWMGGLQAANDSSVPRQRNLCRVESYEAMWRIRKGEKNSSLSPANREGVCTGCLGSDVAEVGE